MKNAFRKPTITKSKKKIAKLEKREAVLEERIEKIEAERTRGYRLVPISKDNLTNRKVVLNSLHKKSMKLEVIDAETELLEVQEDLKDERHILNVELDIAKDSYTSTKRETKQKAKDKKAKYANELLELATKNGSKKELIKLSGEMSKENFTAPMFMKDMRPILNKYKTPRQRPIKSVPKSLAKELMEKVKKIK